MGLKPTSMVYNLRNGVPWHRIGIDVEGTFDSAEAISKGGLDWHVDKLPIQTKTGIDIPDNFALVRRDTSHVFSVVSNIYKPFQNKDAFKFFDSVVKDG